MIIEFDRIGRTGSATEAQLRLPIPASIEDDGQAIAEFVYGYVGKFLVSRYYNVTVDLEGPMPRVWIDGGRFGKGTIIRKETDDVAE